MYNSVSCFVVLMLYYKHFYMSIKGSYKHDFSSLIDAKYSSNAFMRPSPRFRILKLLPVFYNYKSCCSI